LTLVRGDHLEVDEILLRREDQPVGHYIERMGKIDRFEPTWFDRLLPLRRFNAQLFRRVPIRVWIGALPALAYLNARQAAELYVHYVPALKPPLRLARRIVNRMGIPYRNYRNQT
jgi:hypothetical protein